MEHSTRIALDLYRSVLLFMSFMSELVMMMTSSEPGQTSCMHDHVHWFLNGFEDDCVCLSLRVSFPGGMLPTTRTTAGRSTIRIELWLLHHSFMFSARPEADP